jgi:hypothetical protein
LVVFLVIAVVVRRRQSLKDLRGNAPGHHAPSLRYSSAGTHQNAAPIARNQIRGTDNGR